MFLKTYDFIIVKQQDNDCFTFNNLMLHYITKFSNMSNILHNINLTALSYDKFCLNFVYLPETSVNYKEATNICMDTELFFIETEEEDLTDIIVDLKKFIK